MKKPRLKELMCTLCILSLQVYYLEGQVQELITPSGATFIIEEEPGDSQAQIDATVKLKATYSTGNNTFFSLDRIDGLKILPQFQGNYISLNSNGLSMFNGAGTEKFAIKFVSDKSRVSTQEVEILGGSDLSEYFDVRSSASIEPGMLVSIAGEDGRLSITNEKRDKKVVGIISGANGIETGLMMGQKGSIADGDTPIALTGRTYVYANTENGAIEPGDFLTSSSTPGYAMKVKKHRKAKGAIVGKAMTSLKEGSGFVLVLINLQ